MSGVASRLVASPCCLPQLELVPLLELYRQIGFTKLEVYSTRVASAVDPHTAAAAATRQLIHDHGFTVPSFHLPPVGDEVEAGIVNATLAARFAVDLGARVVIFKAETRHLYAEAAGGFLAAIASLPITPVIQNTAWGAIVTASDFRDVLDAIADERMRVLIDLGHLARIDADWEEALVSFRDSLALLHVSDIDGEGHSVPFGNGKIDFRRLHEVLVATGYDGEIVVELELEGHADSDEPTATELRRAIDLLCGEAR